MSSFRLFVIAIAAVTILAFTAWAIPLMLVVIAIVLERQTRPYPTVTSPQALSSIEIYTAQELAVIQPMKARQNALREEKAMLYAKGDRLHLNRREYDGRFDARGEGRVFNANLSKLDDQFTSLQREMMHVERIATGRIRESQAELFVWQLKHHRALAFRFGLLAYCASFLAAWAFSPLWLSQLVWSMTWFPVSVSYTWPAPFVFASIVAAAIVVCSEEFLDRRSGSYVYGWTSLVGSEQEITQFMEAVPPTELENDNECMDGDESQFAKGSPHDILGLKPYASRDEILTAYRKLVKQYHPDFQRDRGPELRELAEHKTQLLNWAKTAALKMARS